MPLLRREYKRFILNDSASLVSGSAAESPLILEGLCARGACVIGDRPLRINEKVSLLIYAPLLLDRPTLKEAKAVWCKKINANLWQAGLDFGIDNLLNF